MDGVIQLRAFVENLQNLECDKETFSSIRYAFRNVVVTGTGFYHGSRADLRKLCATLGLRLLGDLRRYDTTVLVLPLSKKDAQMFGVGSQWRSEKVEKALNWNIPVVSVDWLLEGLAKGAPLPPEKFDPFPLVEDGLIGSCDASEEKEKNEKRELLSNNNCTENQVVDDEEEWITGALQEMNIVRGNGGDLQNGTKDGDLSKSCSKEDATRWNEEEEGEEGEEAGQTGVCLTSQESHEVLDARVRGMEPESLENGSQVTEAASLRSYILEDNTQKYHREFDNNGISARHGTPASKRENSPMLSCSGFSADDNLPWTQLEQAHLGSCDFEETSFSYNRSPDNQIEPLTDLNLGEYRDDVSATLGPKPRCRAVLRIPLDNQENAQQTESSFGKTFHKNTNEDIFIPVKLLSKAPRGNQVKSRHSLKSLQNLVKFAEQIQCRNLKMTVSIKDKNLGIVLRLAAHTMVRAKIVSFYRILGEEWQVEFKQFLIYDQLLDRLASAQSDLDINEHIKDMRRKIGSTNCEDELFVSQKVDACSLCCLESVFKVHHIRKASSAPLSVKSSASENFPAFFYRFELDSDMRLV